MDRMRRSLKKRIKDLKKKRNDNSLAFEKVHKQNKLPTWHITMNTTICSCLCSVTVWPKFGYKWPFARSVDLFVCE